ncbi:hypothetical protein F5B22DRAFT_104527 [Xylaria bambusicola]|uniref:uncharacterized protein n=1 Tax=Xylaria bambusicola TaxID=326684 RepID=UPI002008CCEA|nr:uncharacterized protein F5B22DRAFT_104527 [Xylaria bambusicola]KAI0517431.1 hypothetical protein F5B22DRAFT_104527 [Xylaria bambusicola]
MKLLLYWSVLSLWLGAHGLPGWPQGGTIVVGSAVQFDRDSWEANLAHPNATGNNSIAGFDLSRPWPSTQVDGWHLAINVTSDIPDSQTMNPSNATGRTFTGTSIFLQAPENLRTAFSNQTAIDETTWKICVVVIPNAPQENVTVADDGTCTILSSQCVADLQQGYVDKFSRNQDCYGTPPPTPSSCGDAINTGNFNVQQLPLASIGGKEIFVTASESHDLGDDAAAWDDAVTKSWPVLTIWGWNARANASDDASPTVRLSCISARDVQPGSRVPGMPSSIGARACGSAAAALVIACIAAYALL